MTTDLSAQLRLLAEAHGDPAKLALVAVDFAFPDASDEERHALKQAVEAAAIPHWCDASILAALLELPPAEVATRFTLLDRLNEVEKFEARGEEAVNIHEAARLALRQRMAREEPDRFRELSRRAAVYFATDPSRTGQIEWLYHRLCASPDEAAGECDALQLQWEMSARPQDRDAMALALHELEITGLVTGRARLAVLLYYGENQDERSDMTEVAEVAREALKLAKQIGHATSEARAYDLFGELMRAQNRLTEALQAHQSALRIRQNLAKADPSDLLTKLQEAVAYSRVGDVYHQQGALDEALEAYKQVSQICVTLTKNEPDNAHFLRQAVAAHMRMSDILRDRGETTELRNIGRATRSSLQRLVDQDPDNQDLLRDLAQAHLRIAMMHDADHTKETREALDEAFRIFRDRESRDPNDARILRDLAVTYETLAEVEMAEGDLAAAEAALAEARRILERLIARDPTVTRWHIGLAWVYEQLGMVWRRRNELGEARDAYDGYLRSVQEAVANSPDDTGTLRRLAIAHLTLGDFLKDVPESRADAIPHYEEARRIYAALVSADPNNGALREEQKYADEQLASVQRGLT